MSGSRSPRSIRPLGLILTTVLICVWLLPVGPVAASTGTLWVSRYNGTADHDDVGTALAVSHDGTVVYVTGHGWVGPSRNQDIVTIAYGAQGHPRWIRRYDGPGHGYDSASAVAAGPARVYVAGTSRGAGTGMDYLTAAYTSAGERLWVGRYDGGVGDEDAVAGMGLNSDGSSIFITGSTATIAYRTDGTELWVVPAAVGEYIAVSPDDSTVFVTSVDDLAFLTKAIDAVTGSIRWSKRFPIDGEFPDLAGLVVSHDGRRVYVAGTSPASMGETRSYLLAYSAGGTRLWVTQYPSYDVAWASALAVSPDGRWVYLAGEGPGDIYVARFRANGNLASEWTRWTWPFANVSAMTVNPDGGSVYVVGTTDFYEHGDYLTVALTSLGSERWVQRYDGPAKHADNGAAIVVGPDGSTVFITGASEGNGTHMDYATIAYRA